VVEEGVLTNMETKKLKQTVTIKAAPHEIYEALMDSKKHSEFTGDKAVISRKVGGKFSTYGGYASGVNKALIPDRKIVQTWRAEDWPEGQDSEITIVLEAIENGTRLVFTQSGIPAEQYEDIARGWRDYYWTPLKEKLKGT
jgi:activator of HSP90 ATPase